MQRIFQERAVSSREAEFNRLKQERQERINQIIQTRKQDRETRRKLIFYLRFEEEQQKRLQEEEEARKREGILLVKDALFALNLAFIEVCFTKKFMLLLIPRLLLFLAAAFC